MKIQSKAQIRWALQAKSGKIIVDFETDLNDIAVIEELKDKDIDLTFCEHKEKRSIAANNYLWALCNELGNKLRISKDEVYLNCLRKYGQSEIISVRSNVSVKGFFKYYEEIGTGTVNGKEFTHYKVYKGSSEYDTREMSILVDGVVEDAKEQGIQVLSASELELLKEEWGK